jgi:hypothetical protein
MTSRKSTGIVLALLSWPVAALAQQRIAVAVQITDSLARSVLQGAFVTALRSVADISVVSLEERPDYVISGVVLCEPVTCRDPVSYSASLRLWSPISRPFVEGIAQRVVVVAPLNTRSQRIDSVTALLWRDLKDYETTHRTWAVQWGRDRYEQSIREFVRRLDTECFERDRAVSRLIAATDTAAQNAISRMMESKDWLCWN